MRFSFTGTPSDNAPFYQGTDYNKQFGMAGGPTDPKLVGFPLINITGYANIRASLPAPHHLWNSVDAYDSSDPSPG